MKQPFLTAKLTRNEQKHLDNTKFSCDQCQAHFTYNQAPQHYCQAKINCPAGCAASFAQTEVAITNHIDECPNLVGIACDVCTEQWQYKIEWSKEHSCPNVLIHLIAKLRQGGQGDFAYHTELLQKKHDLEFEK